MKVILTEEQVKRLVCEEIVENLNEGDPAYLYNSIMRALSSGKADAGEAFNFAKNLNGPVRNYLFNAIRKFINMTSGQPQQQGQEQPQQEHEGVWKNNLGNWKLVSDDTLATVYNAVPSQCNNDVVHTASMFKLNLANVLSQKVIAMERTFMKELGLKYGDVVYVEGTDKWDGPWQIQDTMNKRFAGMHKIDILVPRNIRTGKWNNVKISVPADQQTAMNAKNTMKGSA